MRATVSAVVLGSLLVAQGLLSCNTPAEVSAPAPMPDTRAPDRPRTPPATIDFARLLPFLPALPGFSESHDEGSIGKYGAVSISEAERVATSGDREVRVRIVDTTLKSSLAPAIRAAADEAIAMEGPHSPRAVVTDDGIGFVRYDEDRARAELNLLVGDRYVVAVVALGVEGTREVQSIARSLDLAGLARLK